MKRSLIACASAIMFLTGICVVNAASTNFSGNWVLDKSKSQGLPPRFENIEGYTMVVTQDDRQLTVENKIAGGGNAGGEQGNMGRRDRSQRDSTGGVGGEQQQQQGGGRRGGGGGQRGGRGGRDGFGFGMPLATYKLDGSESKIESAGGRGGGATLKAQWKDGGKALELTNSRTFNYQGNESTRTTKDRWELSEGGKVLKVKRTVDGFQGAQESTLVFTRQ